MTAGAFKRKSPRGLAPRAATIGCFALTSTPNYHAPAGAATLTDELRSIARAVLAIGRVSNPETVLIDKHEAAHRLFEVARRVEAAS
jgi:hypothetical protein